MTFDGREGGYIKLHRRLESWPLWQAMPALQRLVWIELLLLANWKDGEGWYGARRYTIRRGQLAHSEESIAERAKVGRQVVRDALARLSAEGAVTREKALPGNQAPWLTTIVNYEKFQGEEDDENPQKNQPPTSLEPASNQPPTPREEGEEREEGNLFPASAEAGQGGEGKKAKGKKETDPRFAPLRAAWCEEYAAAHGGAEYRWGPADAAGVHRVISVPVDELRERARRGLNATGFLRCGTLSKLTSNEVWNQLAGTGPPGPRLVTAGASDRSAFGKGEVAL